MNEASSRSPLGAIVVALLLATVAPGYSAAQSCTQAIPPVFNYVFPNAAGNAPGGVVSADGSRVVMFALPNDASEGAGAELAVFNPLTGDLQYLTSGTAAGVDIFTGEFAPFTQSITGLSRDGTLIAVSGSANFNFPTLQLPGDSAPRQYREVIGFPRPIRLINTSTGVTQVVGALGNVPLQPNQFYIGQVNGISADASKALVEEFIVNVDLVEIDGITRRIVPDVGGIAQAASGLLDIASGVVIEDILARINIAAGGQAALRNSAGQIRMSGDANAFVLESARDLGDPLRPLWSDVTAGGANLQSAPYVFFRAEDIIVPVVDINPSQPRLFGTSSFVFLRNVGRTGTVLGIERGASYVGAPPNPTGANAPATVVLGETPRYVTPPGTLPPARGFFANSFALISPEEDRVYFQHTADLVSGGNPHQSQELYSIRLDTREIRQISNHQDPLGLRFAGEPELLFRYGDVSQVIYAGSSLDHRVVAYTYTNPGGFLRSVKQVDPETGRTTLRAARFGTAEFPASEVRRIMICQ
jgi:hypothetical protein